MTNNAHMILNVESSKGLILSELGKLLAQMSFNYKLLTCM